jgi:hypothetical protein
MREARPNPNKVLANARRVLTLAPPPSPEWIAGKAAEAFARVMLSDLVGAERSARDADDAAAATANQACRGYTLREVARVAAAQGQKRRAKRAIMAAIDASYACGKRQQTVQSLKLAAKILHEPAYAAEATAMQEAMSLNSPFFALATPGRTFPSD